MFYAVLIYLIYSNLLNLTQNFVAQGKVDVFIGVWPIHLLALLIAFALIRNRINPSIKWWRRLLPISYGNQKVQK
jgi:lipopolysaccharide export system permease protein